MAVKLHPDVAVHMQNAYGDRDLRGERKNSNRLSVTFSSEVQHADRPLESVLHGSDSEGPDSEPLSDDASATSPRRRMSREEEEQQSTNNCIRLTLKLTIGIIFFLIVLICSVMSKLTLVSLTDTLRHHTWVFQNRTSRKTEETKEWREKSGGETIALYWYLLLILLLPNAITFLRCLFFGALGKTKKSYPWPRWSSAFLGIFGSLVEVMAMCTLVYLVLMDLSPGVALLALNGVFIVQIAIDTHSAFKNRKCAGSDDCNNIRRRSARAAYNPIDQEDRGEGGAGDGNHEGEMLLGTDEVDDGGNKHVKKVLQLLQCVLEYYVVKVIAGLLQVAGVVGLIIYWAVSMKSNEIPMAKEAFYRPLIGLPLSLLALSLVWSNRFQETIARSNTRLTDKPVSARYKSGLINSFLRIVFYFPISYLVFRYLSIFPNTVDPWCLDHLHHHSSHHPSNCSINLSGHTDLLNATIVHIVLSFVGYFVVWVSCIMTLSQLSVGLPLFLSTPVAAATYYVIVTTNHTKHFFPHFFDDGKDIFKGFMPVSPALASLLWLGELLAMGFYICTKTNIILARDKDMFLTPHYDSVFLEQHTILNRQVQKGKESERTTVRTAVTRNPRMIFICSTMYRESDVEMKQMLTSIKHVADHYASEFRKNERCHDKYESHVFFDGAINADHIENFGLQLLSLLEDTLKVKLKEGTKMKTPYGFVLKWEIGILYKMPFYVHFKDKTLVKPKKRWSQVMYMNYVLNYRLKRDKLNRDDTFILTTDADIDFKAKSVVVLLDMLATNPNVAAVCARTHPKGHGLMYWYQLFDYAIGHWFQKPAEHILGSVLCSPGCFSVFRCSALEKVLPEYSTEAMSATEFLMKDMGEDRWLCTLLIKQGLRLEYCAISEDQTYCPTEFNEFFKQRRRWIPSTVANLAMLVSESGIITRGNDSISILYILFQVVMIFSTAISPATVILVIAAGLQPFNIPYQVTTAILFILGIIYALICLYSSPKTQLDFSKLLTLVFALLMSLVIVGIFKDIVTAIVDNPAKIPLEPGNCDSFYKPGKNQSEEYYQCLKGLNFAANATNGVYEHFSMPVSMTVVYMAALSLTFFLAGVFHPSEFYCLLHSIWFLLGLPAGYLLLLIYSAVNLCDRSWGTREQSSGEDEGLWGWRVYFIRMWRVIASSWCCIRCCFTTPATEKKGKAEEGRGGGGEKQGGGGGGGESKEKKGGEEGGGGDGGSGEGRSVATEARADASGTDTPDGHGVRVAVPVNLQSSSVVLLHVPLDKEVVDWLEEHDCMAYAENFEREGYTNQRFIAKMTEEDLDAIGINKAGFKLRLEKAAKLFEEFQYRSGNHINVKEWLRYLDLEEYAEAFQQEGYKWEHDMENMKNLDEAQLKAMGISKRAHLQRLVKAIGHLSKPPIKYNTLDMETLNWLCENECEEYAEKFVRHGYTNQHFIAGLKVKDFEAIGVEKKGLRLRLEKAASHLAPLTIRVDVPNSVEEWLRGLELSEYTELFHSEGYKKGHDMVSLKELDVKQLQKLGITKKAHLRRMKVALDSLAIPSAAERNKRYTKHVVEGMKCFSLEAANHKDEQPKAETDFWRGLIKKTLKPVSQKFLHNADVQKSLEGLRNSILALLLLVNLMWIVLLTSLQFWQLGVYNIDPRAFQLLFLGVYGFIIIIQFFTMLAHRGVTLAHYLGRIKPREVSIKPWTNNYNPEFMNVSIADLGKSGKY